MSIQLRFMSAIVRKADIASHYPGGCAAFESHHLPGCEDEDLYALFAMSSSVLCDRVEEINSYGLGTGRFIAIGDAWHGPIKQASGISFYAAHTETIPAAWQVEYAKERGHE